MKKIFAIALALVMVLSMASAFASPCTSGFSWVKDSAATKCGKATIEVVPYVKVNKTCGGYEWQVSTCASAVNTEKVYYAVKLNVEANPEEVWFDKAVATLSYKGMVNAAPTLAGIAGVEDYLVAKELDDKASTWYYDFNAKGWAIEDDNFTLGDANVKEELVNDAAKAKVCAKLESKSGDFEAGILGDYYVRVEYVGDSDKVGAMLVVDADDAAKVESGLLEKIAEGVALNGLTTAAFPVENAVGYIFVDGEVHVVGKLNDKCSTSFFNTVTSFFGIELGTKMDKELINKNFGWKDSQESCFSWSDKGASIVDAECVVAIPKTGDASVLAWLF